MLTDRIPTILFDAQYANEHYNNTNALKSKRETLTKKIIERLTQMYSHYTFVTTRQNCSIRLKTLLAFCFPAGNLKETLEEMGDQVEHVGKKLDSLKVSSQDQGQKALQYLKSRFTFDVCYNPSNILVCAQLVHTHHLSIWLENI